MTLSKNILSNPKYSTIAGVVGIVVSIFLSVAIISFFFTWDRDQSLLDASSIMGEELPVANNAGSIGFSTGHLLVADCFGLASLVLVAYLAFVSVKLLLRKEIDWTRTVVLAFAGTLFLSLLLSYFALIWKGGLELAFEGGIGGSAGKFLTSALISLFGKVVTPVIIVAVALIALIAVVPLDFLQISKKTESTAPRDNEPLEDEIASGTSVNDQVYDRREDTSVVIPREVETSPSMDPATEIHSEDEPVECDVSVDIHGPEDVLDTEVEEELPQIDVRGDVSRFKNLPLDLLQDYASMRYTIPQEEIERNLGKIKSTLASFKIPIESISASVGYTVTLYKISLGEGIRVNSVRNLEDDIAIKIGIKGVRVVMLSDAVGIEVPNEKASVVPLKAILNSDAFRHNHYELPVALGYTITTKAKVFDLADAPHLLVAGATKQGKSVGLNAIITSLLYSKHPTELKLVFIDPKMVEFSQYSKLYRHYLAVLPSACSDEQESLNAIVKDAKSADAVLRSLCVEMDERYALLSKAGVNKVTDYNEKYRNRYLSPAEGHRYMPYLVVVIDEYADLTKSTFGSDRNMSRSIENSIIRLAAKGRAAGLHVIIATQRPSVDVITGTIKSNFPTRMAFRTASRTDSMTILDITGAERLIGRGDMLYFSGADAERVQCALIGSDEIAAITSYIAQQTGYKQCCPQPYYLPDPGDGEGGSESSESNGLVDMKNLDPLFEEAARLAVTSRQISTSMLQRKMQLGFARAGRIMDQLESSGVVGPQQGSKPREALVDDLASLDILLAPFLRK